MNKGRKYIKRAGRIILWFMLGIFGLLILFFIFINLPVGKRMVRNQVQQYLQKKLNTNIEIGSIDYSLPQWLEIKNLYVEDLHKDTLLYASELRVDIHMLKLLSGRTEIEKILLHKISANINRNKNDTAFNYQFIIDAFSGKSPSVTVKDTTELKINIKLLLLDSITLNFRDQFAGNDFYVSINELKLRMDKFQPDRLKFKVNDLYANGVDYLMTSYQTDPKAAIQVTPSIADNTEPEKGYPLFITANKLDLRHVNVLLDNKVTGMYYKNNVTRLTSTDALFSMGTTTGTFGTLFIDSTSVIYSSAKADTTEKRRETDVNAAPMPWTFAAGKVGILNTDLRYDDINRAASEGLDLAHLKIKALNTSINDFHFSGNKTSASIKQLAFSDSSGFALDTMHVNFLFTDKQLSVKDLYVKTPYSLVQNATEVSYDSIKGITVTPQNSLVRLKMSRSVIAFNDLFLLAPSLKNSLSGFADQYININTELQGTLKRLNIPFFTLSGFSGSSLDAKGIIHNISDSKAIAFDIFILRSNFLKRDLMKFIPKEKMASFKDLPEVFNLSGHFVGNKNNIAANLTANAKDFSFSGIANLKNISDPSKLMYDVSVAQLAFDKKFIEGFIPAETKESISLPQKIAASGKLNGTKENITADLNINSSYGALKVQGFMKNISNPNTANYDMTLSTTDFALGTLLRQDSVLGNITGNFVAKGVGLDYKTMRSSILADIASIDYNKYHYKNAHIKAQLDNGSLVSSGNINDSALNLHYDITSNLKGEYPTAEGFIRIDTARLRELNFSKDTLNFSLTANVHSKNLKPRNLDASLLLDSIRMQAGKNFYKLDTVSLVGSSAAGIDSIVLNSAFADVHVGGAFDYDKVAQSVQKFVNNYYKIPGYTDSAVVLPAQQVSVNGTIKYIPAFSYLVPGIVGFKDIRVTGSYNNAIQDSALQLMIEVPEFSNTTNTVHNGKVGVYSDRDKIYYEATFDSLRNVESTIYKASVMGALEKDSITLTARTGDKANNELYGISASVLGRDSIYTFRMKDSLLLNGEPWHVSPGNYIRYSPQGIIVNNFLITSDTASISIKSKQLIENSPIDISISKFNLKSISSIINQDTIFLAGVLDVKATVADLEKPLPHFLGDASITDLAVKQHLLGNVTASSQKVSDDNIEAKIALQGPGNDVSLSGNYYPNETENQFNAELKLKQLSFKTIQAFSEGQLSHASGDITGEIVVKGKLTDPTWNGQINFDTANFTITQLGAPFRIDKQKIVFAHPDIKFPEFTIKDSLDHPLKIDGGIAFRSMKDIGLGLKINTKDFVFLNAKKTAESQLYGYGSANVNVSLDGTAENPVIEGDIELNKNTDLTIALPESSYEKNDGSTIVRFIDMDTIDMALIGTGFEEEKKKEVLFGKFLNYNLNIFVNKEASLSMILDPSTGDEIKVQGEANLNAGVDPGGNLVLAGIYELDKGYYDLHYQIINRKFELDKGSTITFAGPPMNANINLSAHYIATTNSRDLLSNEVSDASSTLANSMNQQLPYKVILKLKGQLNKPIISFDIELSDGSSSLVSSDLRTAIENKLQQIRSDPASMNKQVFSLLLFDRFISEQSSDFFKGSGTDFSMLAKQSVSQFLSSALNQIASDVFKGVDIDLNLNSYNDYSHGGNTERTDLKVAVSKNFANERIRVSVGQTIGIEGQEAAAKSGSSSPSYMPDISISYRLSKDGKYMIRAYTENQYEITVDGYMVETGIAFMMTLDYDKFNELFGKKKKGKK